MFKYVKQNINIINAPIASNKRCNQSGTYLIWRAQQYILHYYDNMNELQSNNETCIVYHSLDWNY